MRLSVIAQDNCEYLAPTDNSAGQKEERPQDGIFQKRPSSDPTSTIRYCVTSGKSLNVSELQFPRQGNRNHAYFEGQSLLFDKRMYAIEMSVIPGMSR